MATLILADDHNVVREGLRLLLEAEPDLRVIAEAADGVETVRLVEQLQPDLLIVDVIMPGMNGLQVAYQVKRGCPATSVMMLSMYETDAYVVEALQVGVSAYVLKKATSRELVHAVREVLAGRRYLSPPLNERALEAYTQRMQDTRLDPYESLTAREREILHLAAEGLSNPGIAARLSLSPRTVEMHRANLMRKLRLKTQSELVLYAVKKGVLPVE